MLEFESKFEKIISRCGDVKSFRISLPGEAGFKPGQYFMVTIDVAGKEETKPFSFSNSPTEKGYIEFTKRLTDSAFSGALKKVKEGDTVKVRMPYGEFTFEGEHKKIALLSGGIGITPFRSICKNATDNKLNSDIILLYGNKAQQDIIFRDDLDRMKDMNPNLEVVYTLTSPEEHEPWPGCTGLICKDMIVSTIPDYRERVFYVCGPPQMVKSLCDILYNEIGIDKEKVRLEHFAGYV